MIVEGTPPGRFALEHAHYTEDLPFWIALADEVGGPVLDLGSAVGRVTLALAQAGHDVLAVDGSPDMVQTLRTALAQEPADVGARVETTVCDFRLLDLGVRRFALALMPMNSLQALLTRDDHLACLTGVRRHLAPEGVFAFDVAVPDLESIAGALGTIQPGAEWIDPETGVSLSHSAWFDSVDIETSTVSFTTRIDERTPDGAVATHLRPHTVHLFSPTELWELLHDAGLEVQAVYGDFDGSPFSDEAERQVYRCGVAT